MIKKSAGILLYRIIGNNFEYFIVHPGNPYNARKDVGVWSVPKGEYGDNEDPLEVAKREFFEETGNQLPPLEYIQLQTIRLKSGKYIAAWAAEAVGCSNIAFISSNTFLFEWPPRSGKQEEFPEVDRAEWVSEQDARIKLNPAQVAFIDELHEILNE